MNAPTFHKHGKDWFPHTPGDPMPCDGEKKVILLSRRELRGELDSTLAAEAKYWIWKKQPDDPDEEIIGWSYADTQPETAENAPDELARLREENANMRTAIKEGHTALKKVYLAYCLTTTDTEVCDIDNIAHDALAKLQPFTQP